MSEFTFKSMRRDAQSSVLEWKDMSGKENTIHASEWWNGEGVDFNVMNTAGKTEKFVSLHMEELEAMFVQAVAFGMLDLKEVKNQAKILKKEMLNREESIKAIRS